jgi:hypothetical protein
MKKSLFILTLFASFLFVSNNAAAQNCVNGTETICNTSLAEVTTNIGVVELSITNVIIAGFGVTPVSTVVNLGSITDMGGGCVQFTFIVTMSSNADAIAANIALSNPLFKTVHDIDLQSNITFFATATTTTTGDGVVACAGACPNTGNGPTAVCKDTTVYLDGSGNATIVAADIDGGSTDDCAITSSGASQTTFDCNDITTAPANDLVITGVIDGPITGGVPKAVELYVVNNIADLAQYGLGSANNGGGTDGEEFTFPAVAATAGDYLYIATESVEFNNFFGFMPDYTSSAANINGDDAIELFYQSNVIDLFGDINLSGTNEPWEYLDGWAYRNNSTGPDGTSFVLGSWSFSGPNALDGESTNGGATTPFPVGSFTHTGPYVDPIPVTLTVTDGEALTDNCVANVTIKDTISPVVDVATLTPIVEQCSVSAPTAPTATDNCAGTITGVADVTFPITAQGTSTITWTYNDGNGQIVTQTQSVTIDDTTDPVPTVGSLSPITEPCSSTPTAPTAVDNCAGTITGVPDVTFPITSPGTTTITWTYNDGNGQSVQQTQDVTISDGTNPTASAPSPIGVECNGDVPAPDPLVITDEADNCGVPVVAFVSDVSDGNTCPEVITRTYSVTDAASNQITVTQTITVNDITPPTASNPTGIVVQCNADIPAPDVAVVTDEADNCGAPTVAFVSDVSDGNTCPEVITRTYSVTDNCSSQITVTQLITISDTNDPIADVASLSDINAECESTPTAPTATDNCSGTITGVPDVTFPITAIGTTTVTWTYTDGCSNAITQTQDVVISAIDITVTQSGSLLTSNSTGGSYQWLDCNDNYSVISGETNQAFTASINGSYAVEITNGSCVDTSACMDVTGIGFLENSFGDELIIYPNPTSGMTTISLGAVYENVVVQLKSIDGKLIDIYNYQTASTIEVDITGAKGLYLIDINTEAGESAILRVLKE